MSEVKLVKGIRYGNSIIDINDIANHEISAINNLMYDEIWLFNNGYAIVSKNGFEGVINEKGEEVVACIYKEVRALAAGTFNAQSPLTKTWGVLDEMGQLIINFKYKDLYTMSEELMAFQDKSDKWGFIDKQDNVIVKPMYSAVISFIGGYAAVKDEHGKWGFINHNGLKVVDNCFIDVKPFYDNLAAVQNPLNGKWGYISACGEVVIPFKFDKANSFNDGAAFVMYMKKPYLIGIDGSIISAAANYKIDWENDGYAEQRLSAEFACDGKTYIFNKQNTDSDTLYEKGNGLVLINNGEYKGLANIAGEIIVPPIYEYISEFYNGHAAVSLNNKWGFIDEQGYVIGTGYNRYDAKTRKVINYSYMVYEQNQIKALVTEAYFGIKIGDDTDIAYKWFENKSDREQYLKDNNHIEDRPAKLVLTMRKN